MGIRKFAVTPGFGEGGTVFTAQQLAVLGSAVGQEARIELTTFKQLYVAVEEEQLEQVQARLRAAGLEIHPAGFYTKSLITCNFCRGAEDAGLEAAKKLDEVIAGHPVPSPVRIGYAGCALGTSEPLLKDIAIVKMKEHFDIYVGGETKGLKAVLARLLIAGVREEELEPVVMGLITIFQEKGKKKEKFSKFIDRISLAALRDATAGK
ncbi:nitrite reductase [Paenibacillus lutrae]|uniref:Nitrite reductase n=1 Tax=Paenibacillus lutrae TaxID=2078573 RepID=A0A7X3JZL5_9BACL|nr:nitrite reductase [Paenibacillus lutrae]MVP00309.1 nitrite reductase [Paenibacillus lutrae]